MKKPPRAENVNKIADYFGVSPSYLLNDNVEDIPSIDVNYDVIGNNSHTSIAAINGTKYNLTEQEIALLDIFGKLDIVKQARLLSFASELQNDK